MNIEGKLLTIGQAEMLLLDGEEVSSIEFQIQTETGTVDAYAVTSEGTAYHTLENDTRLRAGVTVEITGVEAVTGFKALTIHSDSEADDEDDSWQAMEKRLQEQGEKPITIHLLNAAVMPHAGHYELEAISLDAFATAVRNAYIDGNLRHYIGYESTLNLIADLCNIDLGRVNVSQTELEDGDIFYVARLRRRVSPQAKRVQTHGHAAMLKISEFDFFRGKYSVMEG